MEGRFKELCSDTGRLHPAIASGDGIDQLFGDSWEWTASAYTGYPGYKPLPGALWAEYNGKFVMHYRGQMILAWRILRHARESLTRNLP